MKPALIVHGGAWDIPDEAVDACKSGCQRALAAGWSILSRSGSALDAIEATAALDAVDSGRAQISFLLNPCDVEQVMKLATAGEVMPQKSTDFYPKLLSGITMYRAE